MHMLDKDPDSSSDRLMFGLDLSSMLSMPLSVNGVSHDRAGGGYFQQTPES